MTAWSQPLEHVGRAGAGDQYAGREEYPADEGCHDTHALERVSGVSVVHGAARSDQPDAIGEIHCSAHDEDGAVGVLERPRRCELGVRDLGRKAEEERGEHVPRIGQAGAVRKPRALQLVIPLEPVAKGRPRAAVIGGRARIYTPSRTRVFEARVAALAEAQLGDQILTGPLALVAAFFLRRPARLSRRADSCGPIAHDRRPDLDNLLKAVVDALSAFWGDDAQIADLRATKWYCGRGTAPRVILGIREVGSAVDKA